MQILADIPKRVILDRLSGISYVHVLKRKLQLKEESIRKTENIYNTTLEIFKLSEKENITTHRAAFNIAQNRIDKRKKERNS